MSAGALVSRGLVRRDGGQLADDPVEGVSWHWRTGVTLWLSPQLAYSLHAGYQSDAMHTVAGDEVGARAVGIGLGMTVLVD